MVEALGNPRLFDLHTHATVTVDRHGEGVLVVRVANISVHLSEPPLWMRQKSQCLRAWRQDSEEARGPAVSRA